MAPEDYGIEGDVTMWPEIDETWMGCHDVATDVDEIGGDVVVCPLKLMRLEGVS